MKRKWLSVTLNIPPLPPLMPVQRARRLGPFLMLYIIGFLLLEMLLFKHVHVSTIRHLIEIPEDKEEFGLLPPDLEDAELMVAQVPQWMTDKSSNVPVQEREHLSWLHSVCMAKKQAIISWQHGVQHFSDHENKFQAQILERDDPRILEQLRKCPDVDIYLPDGIRDVEYCENGVALTKFLHSRMLPLWALEDNFFDPKVNKSVMYYDLCPLTPLIFFNHYWDDRPTRSEWPEAKPIYVLPNLEMREMTANHYWRVDVVLCRTLTCDQRTKAWYAQEGNPRNAKVFYTKFTSSDAASHAFEMIGKETIRDKNFANVRFTHMAGLSPYKGTKQVLDCWLSDPNLPPLDLYIDRNYYDNQYSSVSNDAILKASNVNLIRKRLDALAFGQVMAESSFFLYPSIQEGYGHLINQARASGGFVITTDVHPMNELISSDKSGILLETQRVSGSDILFGGAYRGSHGLKSVDGLVAEFTAKNLCASVTKVLKLTSKERQAMAMTAQRQYHKDTKFFAQRMIQLRLFARQQRHSWVPPEGDIAVGDPEPLRG
ncbi:homeobox and-type helix-turn-helix domain-containing protein [Plasmopara halstedii]|uniref:Homeobox and-type helix-turn-helix domain-containing protein n=1 Tax=Plasmopara halstedii TaxID=4781 RepID=A0A0P1B6P0_PLAHL|nr:homeobox and-type helix-turn-helix domain-containing protein [Plasmopara halstedii]CEG50434.1 homeobox and-type helix-turn-helix domain-containing protein [Plasmopara halstedii]|eukprot:XP_024586803.1 homeobox and-type helix-turn-helix domain-containing protein [Plasmopara halstedii]